MNISDLATGFHRLRRGRYRYLLAVLVVGGIAATIGSTLSENYEAMAKRRQRDALLEFSHIYLENLQSVVQDSRKLLLDTLSAPDPATLSHHNQELNALEQRAGWLLNNAPSTTLDSELQVQKRKLARDWQRYIAVRLRITQLGLGGDLGGARQLDSHQGAPIFRALEDDLYQLIGRLHLAQEVAHQKLDQAVEAAHRRQLQLLGLLFLGLIGVSVLLYRATRRLSRMQAHTMACMREAVLVVDTQGLVTAVNAVALNTFGLTTRSLDGIHLQDIVPELGTAELARLMNRARLTGESQELSQLSIQLNGGPRLFEVTAYPFPTGLTLTCKDISARVASQHRLKEQAEALRESEERFCLAIQGATDGIWDLNLVNHSAYFSPRWCSMIGLSETEMGDALSYDFWLSRVHPEDRASLEAALGAHIEGLSAQFEQEYRMAHASGGWRWMLARGAAVRGASGRATRIAGSQTDITVRKETEDQLVHSVLHDHLTGLPNRALFLERLRQAMEHAHRRPDYGFAVLFLDMDRFKVVNDSLGHLEGDQLLIAVADRIQSILRSADTLARLGGDEFSVLVDDVNTPEDAARVAERIQSVLQTPFQLAGQDVVVSLSIGIALHGPQYHRAEELLRDADIALYQAKSGGRSTFASFDANMHTLAVWRLQMEADLRRAIEKEELRVFYQPIVSLATGALEGLEALVRWPHPERGFISPMDFIPVAEETGMIVRLGEWVLAQACQQMKRWVDEDPAFGSLWVSVNLSARQFVQQDFLERVEEVIRSSGIAPHQLKLELTESAAMDNAERACQVLNQLCCLGVKVAIDDFGTGYSSLSYLHRFPATTLKIDRSFVDKLELDSEKFEIIRTIISLAENLGMSVVAEGIENSEQASRLQALHCQQGQGYLFAKPQDAAAIHALLRSGHLQIEPGKAAHLNSLSPETTDPEPPLENAVPFLQPGDWGVPLPRMRPKSGDELVRSLH